MFFERNCPVCHRPARRLCEPCRAHLGPGPDLALDGLDSVFAAFTYDEVTKRLILGAKNGGRRDLIDYMARLLTDQLDPAIAGRADVVTWVPASAVHRRERGYDQGRLLARSIGRRTGVPARRLVSRAGASQKGLGRKDRLAGPTMSPVRVSPHNVLLVDDVCTTGSSLTTAASALRSAGALQVHALVVSAAGWPARIVPAI